MNCAGKWSYIYIAFTMLVKRLVASLKIIAMAKQTRNQEAVPVMEGYPDFMKARMEQRDAARRRNAPSFPGGHAVELVFEDLKLWQPGVLKVSFKGGDPALHKKIATVAALWSAHANIQFDFGYNKQTKQYRKWRKNDASHIRIGFSYNGYWSLIGTDSKDEDIAPKGEITMNYEGFDKMLPDGWEATVLHEFGHALGFHHEHQSPDAECAFDWPKLYKYLGGPPNNWSKATVNHNMKEMPGGGLTYSLHDRKSVMHYSFPAWMFVKGKASPCFIAPNNKLSASDKKMAAKAYPFAPKKVAAVRAESLAKVEDIVRAAAPGEPVSPFFNQYLEFLRTSP